MILKEFSTDEIERVWSKAEVVPLYNPGEWRKDVCKAWIGRQSYGNRNSSFGWEIDHINSNSGDNLSNLRPLQWKNNLDKSDGQLKCNITSNGTTNIER